MSDLRRILDANLNRAGEAMRVQEEAARFILNDLKSAAHWKKARHELQKFSEKLGAVERWRNTAGDVGTRLSTRTEQRRCHPHDVVIAAGKRLSEALRVLEEYGKILNAPFAAAIKALRYQTYDLSSALAQRLAGPPQWRLCVLISEALCAQAWEEVARRAVAAGADCLQLREKDLSAREWVRRTERLCKIAGSSSAVIVNDRIDVAAAAGAQGAHLGTTDLPIVAARHRYPDLWIGASTHTLSEARAALRDGADHCGVGAMFQTITKKRKPSGTAYLRRFIQQHPNVPHLAIGGITPRNIAEVIQAGARGVAVSSVVCADPKPERVVRQLLRAMPKPRRS